MVIAVDTSYLFSLYGEDSHSRIAVDWIKHAESVIHFTSLCRFELFNSLRFSEFQGYSTSGRTELTISDFSGDCERSLLVEKSPTLDHLITEAERISLKHTLIGGHRSFDILHVAAAKLNKSTHFLTFDKNQKKLAEKEGLIVPF